MEGKPSLATLKTRMEDYKPAETSAEGGVVISSADGIVHCRRHEPRRLRRDCHL